MIRIAAALAAATLLVLAASCGGASDESGGDAQTLLQQSQAAMEALNSYHATITISGEGIAGSGEAIESDWAAPASFRSLTPMVRLEGIGACEPQKAGEFRRSGCTNVRRETLDGYVESIVVGGGWYSQLCQEKGSDCAGWEVRDAGPLAIMGLTLTQADWTITALTMVREAEVIGEESMDGLPTVHLKGRLNTAQAKVEAARRAAQDARIETVGEECVEEVATPMVEGDTPTVTSTPQCRPVSVEEFLALSQEAIEQQERNPDAAEVWIGRDDHLVRRFSTSFLPDEAGEGRREVAVEFSRFNEVVIEPPR